MTATVTHIDGHLATEWPGASGFRIAADAGLGILDITCPTCGRRTRRYFAEEDDFEIRHRRHCRHERIIRRLVARQPARLGERHSDLRFHVGDHVLVVRDSMPVQGPEDLRHVTDTMGGARARTAKRKRRVTVRRRRKSRRH